MCYQRDVAVVDERVVDKSEVESAFGGIGDVENVRRFARCPCLGVISP